MEERADIHRADLEDPGIVQAEAVVRVDLQAAVEALEVVLVGPLLAFQGAIVVHRMEATDQEAAAISKLINLEVSSLHGTSFWFCYLRC